MSSRDKTIDTAETGREEYFFGFCFSFLGHLLLGGFLILRLSEATIPYTEPVVYSVTLDGGKTLGGKLQVAEKENTPKAPMKNVSAPEKKVEEKTKEIKPKEDPKKVEDAEISLAKQTPTPKPSIVKTPQPTPVKKSTPKPTPPPVDTDKEYQKALQRYLGESSEAGGKGFGAAKLGGSGMGGGTQRSAEFMRYYNLLRTHIKKGWRWYDTSSRYTARAYFRLEPDGEVKDIRIIESSGNKEFDDSVLRALSKANPVPAPPEKEYQNFKELKMLFDPRE